VAAEMTVDETKGSGFCLLESSDESQDKAQESANTVLVKVMTETGAFRMWLPEATYQAVMRAVKSTGVAGQDSTILYMDEDGDRCVLNPKTFFDCAALAKNRFKLWVQKAEPEKKSWEERKSLWAEKKCAWAEAWAEKKKLLYVAGYKAGYEVGLQKGAEVVMGEGEGKDDSVIEAEAEAAAANVVDDEIFKGDWRDMKWKGWGMDLAADSEPSAEGGGKDWKGCWKGKGKGKGKGKALLMHLVHGLHHAAAHAEAHARAHEQAMGASPDVDQSETQNEQWAGAWNGKGAWKGAW